MAYARAEIHNRRAIDLAWCEFPDQDFEAIAYWANKVRREHPDLGLAINLSSSFDWTDPQHFPLYSMEQLADLGFKYMFMTLADNHAGRNGSWEFFLDLRERGIAAFPDLQRREAASETPSAALWSALPFSCTPPAGTPRGRYSIRSPASGCAQFVARS